MAWCLMTPSHYLNQCWLISKVQWHSSEANFTRDTQAINHYNWSLSQNTCKLILTWWYYTDGLMQRRCNSSAFAMELRLFCIKLLLCYGGLAQEIRNSIANAHELRLSCTNPSMWLLEEGNIYKNKIYFATKVKFENNNLETVFLLNKASWINSAK